MANTVANVIQGSPNPTGAILSGPLTATLPTDAIAATTGFVGLGYAGDDGLEEAPEKSTDRKRAWGGDVIKVTESETALTYKFVLVEARNTDVLKEVFGDANVTVTAATTTAAQKITIKKNGATLPHKKYIFEMKEGYGKTRITVPDGQITEIEPVTYTDSEVVAYSVTLETYRDTAGQFAYEYYDTGLTSTGTPV